MAVYPTKLAKKKKKKDDDDDDDDDDARRAAAGAERQPGVGGLSVDSLSSDGGGHASTTAPGQQA